MSRLVGRHIKRQGKKYGASLQLAVSYILKVILVNFTNFNVISNSIFLDTDKFPFKWEQWKGKTMPLKEHLQQLLNYFFLFSISPNASIILRKSWIMFTSNEVWVL